MRYLRISLILILLGLCQFAINAQKGNYALRDSTLNLPSVNNNTILGTKAAPDLDRSGNDDNTLFGSYAGFKLNTGGGFNTINGLTLIGSRAGYNFITTTRGIANATFVGAFAGYNGGTGVININRGVRGGTFIGYKAGYAGGNPESIAIGVEAGLNGVSSNSIVIGASSGALRASATGCYNDVFIGTRAGYNFGGQDNTFVGNSAGSGTDTKVLVGYENTFLGSFSGYTSVGNTNTFVGVSTGLINNASGNTFIGHNSGSTNTTGSGNTFLGKNSGLSSIYGGNNTFLGYEAGKNIRSSGNNTFVGYDAGIDIADSSRVQGSVVIGTGARATESYSFILGNQSMRVGIGNTAPQNKLEITSAITNTSGLRFTNLKSTSTPSISNSLGLSVDANGDVILVPAGGGGSATPDSMLVKYIGTTKFVGLGIASPIEKLHVSGGNLRVDNVLPRYYMKNTSTGTDCTLAELANDNIIKLANKAIHVEAFGGLPSLYIKNNAGNIGIGNTNPTNKLEITTTTANTSGLRFTNLKSTSTPSISNNLALSVDANGDVILVPAATGGLTNPVTNLQVLSGTAGVSGLRLNNLPNTSATVAANGKALSVDETGNIILVPVTNTIVPAGADVWDQLINGADYLIRNKNNKSVMIGTVAAAKTSIDYKLYVEKGILTEKVKISAQANWPDYVFGKNYSLMPLKEVENFIATNNHLPEVPSAKSIEKDGLDLGKMDATLLKKIEELTLYLIEQNKKIDNLQAELTTLKSQK